MTLPPEFESLGHEEKLRALTRKSGATIRTEIDRLLGIPNTEYSGSQPYQFSKEELATVLLGLGGPEDGVETHDDSNDATPPVETEEDEETLHPNDVAAGYIA
jgi:hypothetical protein